MKFKNIGLTAGAAVLAFVAGGVFSAFGGNVAVADEVVPEISVVQEVDETADSVDAGFDTAETVPTAAVNHIVNGIKVETIEPFFTPEFKAEFGLTLDRNCIAFQDSPNTMLIQATVDRPVEIGAIWDRPAQWLPFLTEHSTMLESIVQPVPDGSNVTQNSFSSIDGSEIPWNRVFEVKLVNAPVGNIGEVAWRLTSNDDSIITDVKFSGIIAGDPLFAQCRSTVLITEDVIEFHKDIDFGRMLTRDADLQNMDAEVLNRVSGTR